MRSKVHNGNRNGIRQYRLRNSRNILTGIKVSGQYCDAQRFDCLLAQRYIAERRGLPCLATEKIDRQSLGKGHGREECELMAAASPYYIALKRMLAEQRTGLPAG